MPQNPQATVELKHLAAVKRQIISPASNSSIVGIFQDSSTRIVYVDERGCRVFYEKCDELVV